MAFNGVVRSLLHSEQLLFRLMLSGTSPVSEDALCNMGGAVYNLGVADADMPVKSEPVNTKATTDSTAISHIYLCHSVD
ncbi:hypothetical protein HBI73_251480 [Parastagonospora nodorum]|nr:hypothetical protein HBI73_251480 [Parastagonospora nodorum]KAH5617379.1 hypothetical protein HBI23_257980 [Parastagonospora nodorum]